MKVIIIISSIHLSFVNTHRIAMIATFPVLQHQITPVVMEATITTNSSIVPPTMKAVSVWLCEMLCGVTEWFFEGIV